MKKDALIRFGSLCSLSAGLLLAVGWTINIKRDSLIGASLVLAGYVLALFAFISIYDFQREKLGVFGFLAFVLLIISCTLFTPWLFFDIARISGIVTGTGWKEIQESGPTHVIGVIGGFGVVVGFFLLGITTIQAKLLSKWPAILLIIASIMPLIYSWLPIGKLLPRIGGLALVGFGLDLWAKSKKQSNR